MRSRCHRGLGQTADPRPQSGQYNDPYEYSGAVGAPELAEVSGLLSFHSFAVSPSSLVENSEVPYICCCSAPPHPITPVRKSHEAWRLYPHPRLNHPESSVGPIFKIQIRFSS